MAVRGHPSAQGRWLRPVGGCEVGSVGDGRARPSIGTGSMATSCPWLPGCFGVMAVRGHPSAQGRWLRLAIVRRANHQCFYATLELRVQIGANLRRTMFRGKRPSTRVAGIADCLEVRL